MEANTITRQELNRGDGSQRQPIDGQVEGAVHRGQHRAKAQHRCLRPAMVLRHGSQAWFWAALRSTSLSQRMSVAGYAGLMEATVRPPWSVG